MLMVKEGIRIRPPKLAGGLARADVMRGLRLAYQHATSIAVCYQLSLSGAADAGEC